MKNVKTQKGFSLVELMIVVAIIGILAAVAIPNFQRFQRKSRQSEARNMLTAYYTAEKAAQAEYNTFLGNFAAIGFRPEGQVGYRVLGAEVAGIAAINNGAAPSGYVAACTGTNSAAAGCNTPVGGGAAFWTERAYNANLRLGINNALAAPAAATATTFTSIAGGWVGGGQADNWTVNENRVFTNTQDGLN